MHAKAKETTVAGTKLVIAPLSMKQIEDLVENAPLVETTAEARARLWKQLEGSLRRSEADNPSIETLKVLFDVEDFLQLQDEVYDLSKLQRRVRS